MEALGFMFFSTVETFSMYVFIMSVFRYKVTDYIWQALIVILLANVQSFILRNELSVPYLAPLITILIFIFLFTTVVKIPVIWSAIMTIIGYVFYALVQTVYVSFLFGSVREAQSTDWNGYMLQLISAVTVYLISWVLYKFGLGFSFDMEKLRLKFEHILVLSLIVICWALISVILFYNHIWLNVLFFAASFAVFIYYAIKKETV